MLLPEHRGYATKISTLGKNGNASEGPMVIQSNAGIGFTLGFPPDLYSKILLLKKKLHTHSSYRTGENQSGTDGKLPPCKLIL